ncbi:rap guanine nucleotide exchange factor 1-like [Planoprotostelium fungivorum]|uniref:Rap guanine nucleotide exchange factor 1-like n=1 Tax=Planoprotostelium fungivorum TaxID=1890364 RepID=A0A2P6N1J0_9EUKA|nr:rap guanine nucleotide exchange factor 1-like [Planoprotostelium fungivorum]
MSTLYYFSEDVFFLVVEHLDVTDLLILERTCAYFRDQLRSSSGLWKVCHNKSRSKHFETIDRDWIRSVTPEQLRVRDGLVCGTMRAFLRRILTEPNELEMNIFFTCFSLEMSKYNVLRHLLVLTEDSEDEYHTSAVATLQFWIDRHWSDDFMRDKDVLHQLICHTKCHRIELQTPKSSEENSPVTMDDESYKNMKKIQDGGLLNVSSKHLAEQLCLLDMEGVRTINKDILLEYAENRRKPPLSVTSRFNRLSAAFATAVLREESTKKRVKAWEKVIRVAHHLEKLGNFQSLGCVAAGLSSSALWRLTDTQRRLSRRMRKKAADFDTLMAPTRTTLRSVQSNTDTPRIPFIALTLNDLSYAVDGNERYVGETESGDKLISWWRWSVLYNIISSFLPDRENVYRAKRMTNVMRVLDDLPELTKEWVSQCWERSLVIQPRQMASWSQSPTRKTNTNPCSSTFHIVLRVMNPLDCQEGVVNSLFLKSRLSIFNSWNGILLAVGAVMLFLIFEGTVIDSSGLYDRCLIDRFDQTLPKSGWNSPFTSSIIFGSTQLCVLLYFICISIYQPEVTRDILYKEEKVKIRVNWDSQFVVSYTIVWYICTYCLCYSFKEILGDYKCSRHANSVSGHYCYHIFYMLSVAYLTVRLERNPQVLSGYYQSHGRILSMFSRSMRPSHRMISLFLTVIYACSLFTLSQTYLFGYHTPKQIFYGSLLAVLSHSTLIYLLERGCKGHPNLLPLALIVKFIFCFSFVSIVTHEIPFKTRELVLCALMLGSASYSYFNKLGGRLRDTSKIEVRALSSSGGDLFEK